MKVALVHAFQDASGPGGADEAVLDQAAALGRAGHEVRLVSPATTAAATMATVQGRGPLPELRAFAPDIVHVHHLPAGAFGRSWTTEWTRPLVATLHERRPPDGDGAGDRWAGVRDACRRGARRVTLPLARAPRDGVRRDPLLRRADRVIVLCELSRETYERAGLPPERLAVLPHYVPIPVTDGGPPVPGGDTWVWAGRLAPEENVLDLLRRWPAGRRLDIVGAGPLEQACRAAAPASVRFLGARESTALRRALPGYRGLVLPGRWPAGTVAPVYPEALAAGLPVLAFEGSAAPRTVRADGTGTVASWDAPLPAALDAAERIFPTLRAHCRAVHAKRYGEAVWVERAEELYARVVRSAADSG